MSAPRLRLFRLSAAALLLVLPAALVGCGSGKGEVSGKVTHGGKALEFGSVQFMPNAGGVLVSEIAADGSYSIKGIPTGRVKISVSSVDPAFIEFTKALAMKARGPDGGLKGGGKPAVIDEKKFFRIPEKYSDFDQSGLTYEVKSGPQTLNIDLK